MSLWKWCGACVLGLSLGGGLAFGGEAAVDELPLEAYGVWPAWTEAWVEAAPLPGEGFVRVPFWTPVGWAGGAWNQAPRGWAALPREVLPRVVDGALEVPGGALAVRPFAAHREHMAGTTVRGSFQGPARLVVRSGDGRLIENDLAALAQSGGATLDASGSEIQVRAGADGWHDFVWTAAEGALVPRFEVALGRALAASPGVEPARFGPLEVRVLLPTPTAAQLDARIAGLVVETLDRLVTQGRDHVGPRATHFWTGLHDVDTGAPLAGGRGTVARAGYNPVLGALFDAVEAGLGDRSGPSGTPLAAHQAAAVRDFLELCINTETHLPRRYDPLADRPVDEEPIEAAAYLDFLIDLAEATALDAPLRDAARAAAIAMGHALIDHGTQPNGEVAAVVRAADGWISTNVVHLRRLDVPAQLVRLAALCRALDVEPELQVQLVDAAREAVLEVEYANYWPGAWDRIDPGFDDSYGHIGARSAAMASAWPSEPAFARLALTGRHTYLPLWRDALAFGGSVAADQVRCWKILNELDALNPAAWSAAPLLAAQATGELVQAPGHKPTHAAVERSTAYFDLLMDLALANHFVGEATDASAWLDVTIVGFAPATNLPVGDIIGLPQNLFSGFATVRALERRRGGDATAEQRAMMWTLLDVVEADWGAEYGFADGRRSSGGGIRLVPGLIRWLAAG